MEGGAEGAALEQGVFGSKDRRKPFQMTPDSRITPAEHRLCFSKAILPQKPGEGTGKSWHSPDFSWLMALTTTLPMGCGYHQYHWGFSWPTVGSWLHLQPSRCLLDPLVTETSSCPHASFPVSPRDAGAHAGARTPSTSPLPALQTCRYIGISCCFLTWAPVLLIHLSSKGTGSISRGCRIHTSAPCSFADHSNYSFNVQGVDGKSHSRDRGARGQEGPPGPGS